MYTFVANTVNGLAYPVGCVYVCYIDVL